MNRPFRHKNIVASLKSIGELDQKKILNVEDSKSEHHGTQITIWKGDNVFEFLIEDVMFKFADEYSSIFDTCVITNFKTSYYFEKDSLLHCSFNPGKEITKGKLTSLISKDFNANQDSYYRAIQKIRDNPSIGQIGIPVDLRTDQKETLLYGGGIIQLNIQGVSFDIFRISVAKDNYIVIDSTSRIRFDLFDSIVNSFFASYGFVFGEIVGEEIYYISSNDKTFSDGNNVMFKTITQKSNVESTPIWNRRIEGEGKLFQFPKTAFEKMCDQYQNDTSFFRVLNILREGLLVSAPLAKCIIFSSAIETITLLILKSKNPPTPVNRERFKKGKVLKKLTDVIKNDNNLNDEEKKYLIEKKLNNINKPTFTDTTLEAFKIYHIELPKSLIEITKYRNKYLHGSIPEKIEYGENFDDLSRAFELEFLASILVLKYCGYSGYVQNKSAILEYHATRKKDPTKMIKMKRNIYYKI